MSTNKNTKKYFADHCELVESLKYSGLYTDLCGMSVEDYIKAGTCHCCDNGGEGGDDPIITKKNNTLTFTVNQDGYLIAYLTYAPTEVITVNCFCEEKEVQFVINDGGIKISDVIPTNEKIVVTNVTFYPSEDEKYKYGDFMIKQKTSNAEKIVYSLNNIVNFKDLSKIKNLSNNYVEYTVTDSGVTIEYLRDADTSFPDNFYDDDFDYDGWLAENSYVPTLIVDKEQFNNGEIKVFVGSDDVTKYFIAIDNVTINGETYSIIAKFTDDPIVQHLEYNGIMLCTFGADGEINVKYTVK